MHDDFPPGSSGLLSLIRSAIKAVPAVRYALGVAGIGAAVALIAGFTIDLRVAVFGIIILFVFMAVMVVFARLASVAAGSLYVLAMVLAWAAVILVISTSMLLLTSVFFNWPRPLSRWIEGTAAVTPTPAPSQNSEEINEAIPEMIETNSQPVQSVGINPDGELAWSETTLLESLWFTISPDESKRYSFAVHIGAEFLNAAFNRKPYVASLPPPRIVKSSNDRLDCSVEKISEEQARNPDQSPMEWTLYLRFAKKPQPPQELKLAIGSYMWNIKIGSQKWKSYGMPENKLWWGAQGSVHLFVGDPNWPILNSARLLPLRQENTSLLELVIENRSRVPLPLDNIVLSAQHPSSSETECLNADPSQEVTLNWHEIISHPSENNYRGVWTKINETEISVATEYSLRGECSDYHLTATVPVRHIVAARQVVRFSLKLLELPTTKDQIDNREKSLLQKSVGPPTLLNEWKYLSVSVTSAEELYPKSTALNH